MSPATRQARRVGEAAVRRFDPFRSPNSNRAKQLLAYILGELLIAEAASGARQRARRRKDQETLEATVAAVIFDLAHLALSRSPSRLTITRSRAVLGCFSPKYRAPALNGQLPAILDALVALGFVGQSLGDRSGFAQVFTLKRNEKRPRERTTIWSGPRLLRAMELFGITFGDLQNGGGEVLVLKGAREDRWSPALPTSYEETGETRRLRREVDTINRWLAAADITLLEENPGELAHIDTSDRYLRRVFTRGSFKSGGRLAGGFWMNLERHLRLSRMRIDGEPVASLDYSSLNPRLLYAKEGVEPAGQDLYDVPGFEGYRAGAKRLLNALCFDTRPRTSKPKRTPEDIAEGVVLFPPDKSVAELIAALAEAHRPIAHHFGSGVGHGLQYLESTILVAALLRLKRAGITSLPVHDAMCVQRSKIDDAEEIMEEVTKEVVGMKIPITIEVADEDT